MKIKELFLFYFFAYFFYEKYHLAKISKPDQQQKKKKPLRSSLFVEFTSTTAPSPSYRCQTRAPAVTHTANIFIVISNLQCHHHKPKKKKIGGTSRKHMG